MNELQSISQLFQNRLFRIPDYQRGYAWKHDQLVDFWDDLINLHIDRYHYTGLLSLRQLTKEETTSWTNDAWLIESDYKPCHVVDGQQRLTTISILMNELVSFIRTLPENTNRSDADIILGYETLKDIRAKYISRKRPPQYIITSYLFGYEVDNPTADYLQYKIFEEQFSGTVEETYYTKNLKYAKSFFHQRIVELYGNDNINEVVVLYKKLTQKLMFNIHEIKDDYDVFVAFETMNNRGKPLTSLELLKNRLIYLTTLFDDNTLDCSDKSALRKQINDTWKEIYYQLGRNRSVSLSDDEFLRAHWIIFFQYSRQKGNDYIKFLLNQFSAKHIYEKNTTAETYVDDDVLMDDQTDGDDETAEETTTTQLFNSKLKPSEIDAYVRSLKETAKYWYYTFFPWESNLTNIEKQWIDRLNRIGIGYFRPLVTAALTPSAKSSVDERITLFKAIERFIFICFRMGMFQSSYQSSVYNRKAKALYYGEITTLQIAEELTATATSDTKTALTNFATRIDKKFADGEGFYGSRDLRYLLFEYEVELSDQNKIQKVDWSLFTKVEKDKITIEHILPQTPTKWYWRNQFRLYSDEEIKILSGSLGNLLPLAQSINSGLQNDGFEEKKTASASGRRGYENGSHSEIEIAKENGWNADRILERGKKLLSFMEKRWDFRFANDEQKLELLHLSFLQEPREDKPEIPEPDTSTFLSRQTVEVALGDTRDTPPVPARRIRREGFWHGFVEYCNQKGRTDISIRKPSGDNWYDVPIHNNEYHIFFNLIGRDTLRVGIYVYDSTIFARLEGKKEEIESHCGFPLDWYSSKETSVAKRILYSTNTNIYVEDNQTNCFNWLITHFDALHQALLDSDSKITEKHQPKPNTYKEPSGVLTKEMTAIAYQVAQKVYTEQLSRSEGKDEIVKQSGMNSGSAGDYITGFLAMMDGVQYTRTLNEYATRYYLEHIEQDYGIEALHRALNACEQHAKYYATLGHGRLAYIEHIVDEYRGRNDSQNQRSVPAVKRIDTAKIIDSLIAKTDMSTFYETLSNAGCLVTDYNRYMKTAPVNVDRELERLSNADFELCCAMLTMLVREDYFSNGSFERRRKNGDVDAILMRMKTLVLDMSD